MSIVKNSKAKVEYYPREIKNARVQCPQCKKWYHPFDVVVCEDKLDYDILEDTFMCPKCRVNFKIKTIIETDIMPEMKE